MSETIVIPGSGLVVTSDSAPIELAEAWEDLSDRESQIRSVKREISDLITARLDHEGRRSLTLDGVTFETTAPTAKEWDLAELERTLHELEAEGTISTAKAMACVKWEPKAVWNELKTLLSDPRCKARIEFCFKEVPAPRYAKVKRA